MSLAVVRCPACRGASRVSADAIGHMVGCPRCHTPFVAEEEIPVVQPVSRPAPSRTGASKPPTARPATAVPVAPPRRRGPTPSQEPESDVATAEAVAVEIPDPEHDPHRPPVAGLPVSVLVGLALLPFGIPLLWLVTPLVTGQAAALSMAVPVSLAIAAAALCLGVVYTIDWTATTRIKGVLMLVGLSYLSAAGLYFLKKDMMDRVQAWGGEKVPWQMVQPEGVKCRVLMPGRPEPANDQPLPILRMTGGKQTHYRAESEGVTYRHLIAWTELRGAPDPDEAWFTRVRDALKQKDDPKVEKVENEQTLIHREDPKAPGRQWTLTFADGTVRIVQVFVIDKRVYYLSVEGPQLSPDNELAQRFFESFFVSK
jgi:hypothetical protein